MKKTPTRIYSVTDHDTAAVHLVRATNQAQAIRYIASTRYSATVASQDNLVELVAGGHTVDDATANDEPDNAEQCHS